MQSLYPDTAELMTRAAENGRTADAAAAADDANAAARKLKATPSRRYLDLQLSSTLALGADLITQRLALWGVHVDGGGGEDDAIIVDDDKVHEELPDFLAAQLPLWDGSEKQQHSIVIFQHDRTQARAPAPGLSALCRPCRPCAHACVTVPVEGCGSRPHSAAHLRRLCSSVFVCQVTLCPNWRGGAGCTTSSPIRGDVLDL